ncbi:hypothetical protein [uncultured Eubacterium sp.]|uniref:hypothetical protein n=1 Tax=uncultured Eubacterium sp. TaxID=165185 RepID=UPI0025F2CD97|nr:hypothetical protein [uncultured Eubacterium sp.]
MTEKYIMRENYIPDGILHDHDLYNVSLDDNVLTLSFETHLFSDQKGNEFCEKYKNFTKCHIKCRLEDEYFCNAELKTSFNRKNMYKVKSISIAEFVDLANSEIQKQKGKKCNPWEYLYTYASPNINEAVIELSIYAKYKGVIYPMCNLELNTKEIEFIWE